jgi:lipopolysaccharide/colanic/teichoic acid biosynthesis glycosyltransferase
MAQVEVPGGRWEGVADPSPVIEPTATVTRSRRLVAAPDAHAAARPVDGFYVEVLKPTLDRCFAAAMLVLLSPLLALTALALRMTLGKGIIYRQQRVGRDGVPFTVLKFRTMRADRRTRREDVEVDRRVTHKSTEDPRHTRLGRIIRAAGIDEMPQLVNVVRGEMSIVGPRPELPSVVERYQPWEHARHAVKPGITGLWQIRERGRGARMHECVDIDLEYVDTIGFWTDLKILAATPYHLLLCKGE